jgi:hypothetical protein
MPSPMQDARTLRVRRMRRLQSDRTRNGYARRRARALRAQRRLKRSGQN